MRKIEVTYFSDVLCIWAYVAQARVDAVKQSFADQVELSYRFCSVFGDARTKLANAWKDRDGFAGYSRHVTGIGRRFPHVAVHPEVWTQARPASSASPHLFLAAVKEWERASGTEGAPHPVFESVMWAFRRGFFGENRDIAQWDVQCDLARPFGVDIAAITARIHDGTAFARLSADYQDAERLRIEGSPTFVLNEGRQKLYGNVGFRIIDANLRELLRDGGADEASWC